MLLLYSLKKLYTSLPVLNLIFANPNFLNIGVIKSPILVNTFSSKAISFFPIASEKAVKYSSGLALKYSSLYSLLPLASVANNLSFIAFN